VQAQAAPTTEPAPSVAARTEATVEQQSQTVDTQVPKIPVETQPSRKARPAATPAQMPAKQAKSEKKPAPFGPWTRPRLGIENAARLCYFLLAALFVVIMSSVFLVLYMGGRGKKKARRPVIAEYTDRIFTPSGRFREVRM
jgi:hypothetical protein